jgi:hypothetical protein
MKPKILNALVVSFALLVCALCAERGFAGSAEAPAGQKCRVAVVNPVSGYAECVEPRGAPVDRPPPRPPPTPDECRKHPDLDLESCRQPQPRTGAAPFRCCPSSRISGARGAR